MCSGSSVVASGATSNPNITWKLFSDGRLTIENIGGTSTAIGTLDEEMTEEFYQSVTSVELKDGVKLPMKSAVTTQFAKMVNNVDLYVASDFTGGNGENFGLTFDNIYYPGTVNEWVENVSMIANQTGNRYVAKKPYNLYANGQLVEGEIVIPDTITKVTSPFYYASNITSIVVEGNYTLQKSAFAYCRDLVSASLPLITTLDTTFSGCISLVTVDMLNVTSIGSNAFNGCTSLALTGLPSGVTSIGSSAFNGCTNLALTSLPEGVTSIGSSAFRYCTNLALTSLPVSLTNIGGYTFQDCTSLALTELPSGVTSIGTSAFNGCSGITSLTFNSAITIGEYSFRSCKNLQSVYFTETAAELNGNAFYQCGSLNDIYVSWAENAVANAPWGAANATIHYSWTGGTS